MKERTKALAIPRPVKRKVAERDSVDGWPCCIWCGRPAPVRAPLAFSCAHYISRAQGGLGIPENILTLCFDCHSEYDATEGRDDLRDYFRAYLSKKYPDWQEDKLVYKKQERNGCNE